MTPATADCDTALLLIAAQEERPLGPGERRALEAHLRSCESCGENAAAAEPRDDDEWLWIARVPRSAAPARARRPTPPAELPFNAAYPAATTRATEPDVAPKEPPADEPAPSDLEELPTIDPEVYHWQDTVARGGMGWVVRAHDRRLGRTVAIKELLSDSLRERFEHEARLTARLQHPSIVNIYEAGRWPSGEPFFAMKLVEGESLGAALAARPDLPARLGLLPSLIAVADAIAYAHSKGVIHRDLKPANILCGAFGETVVVDWGLAKDLADVGGDEPSDGPYRDSGANLTEAGAGTPGYMSPEQARGGRPDARMDVYALGATLYHLLAGQSPYGPGSAHEVAAALLAGPPAPITSLASEAPPDLVAIAAKAMARDAAARYPSAVELAADLRRYQTGQLVSAHSYSLGQLARRFVRRHRAVAAIAASALTLCAGFGALSVHRIVGERGRADGARADAETAYGALLEEQGRRELLAGRGGRALAYLSEAYRRGRAGDALRYLLAESAHTVEDSYAVDTAGEPIVDVAFAGGGAYLIVGLEDEVQVRDAATRAILRTLPGELHGLPNPDGTRVVTRVVETGSAVVRVWNLHDGSLAVRLGDADSTVLSATFSRDGSRVAAGQIDRSGAAWSVTFGHSARVWDAATGAVLAVVRDEDTIQRAELSPDGSRLVTEGSAQMVELWRPDGSRRVTGGSAQLVKLWRLDGSLVGELGQRRGLHPIFSADGQLVLVRLEEGFAVWNARDGRRVTTLEPRGFLPAFSSSRPLLALSVGEDILVYDTTTWKVVARHRGRAWVTAVDFAPDGQHVAVGDAGGGVAVFAATTGEELGRLDAHQVAVRVVRFSPDGERVLSRADDGTARVLQGLARQPARQTFSADPVLVSALAPDGRSLLAGGHDAAARLWDIERGDGRAVLGSEGIWAVAYSSDGALVATSSSERHEVALWDARSGAPRGVLRGHDDRVTVLAFSADGAFVAGGAEDRTVRLWRVADGALVATLPQVDRPDTVVFSPDGRYLATAGAGPTASLWAVDRAERLADLAHAGYVSAVAFSPDGALLLTTASESPPRLWRVPSGAPLHALEASHGATVARFSPDGRRLAVAGGAEIRIWDPVNGALLATVLEHYMPVLALAFHPGGQLVASSDEWGIVHLSDVTSGQLLSSWSTYEMVTALTFRADGTRLVASTADGNVFTRDLAFEARSPATVAALVAALPWRIAGGRLTAR